MKGKRTCENCHTEIDAKVKFCPSCGKEQPELKIEEVLEEETKEESHDDSEVKEAEIVEEKDNNE